MIGYIYKVILTIGLIISTSSILAQVITPSIDPVLPSEMSSAVAWRIGSTVGASVFVAIEEDPVSGETNYDISKGSVIIALQPGSVVGEVFYSPFKVSTIDSSTDVDAYETSIKLAIRGNRTVSVGVGYAATEIQYPSGTRSDVSFEGAFSLRMLDGAFFAGAGMQRHTSTISSGETAKWNDVLAGVAFQFGDPIKTMFRTELSLRLSPEAEYGNLDNDYEPETDEYQGVAEFTTGTYLLSYLYKRTIYRAGGDDIDDMTQETNRLGLGVKLGGFNIGLYGNTTTITWGLYSGSVEFYQLTLGYNFI
ncbi:hypothetical protein KKA14_04075 [bacterium]|nr:hypothetical protein [bacterium]